MWLCPPLPGPLRSMVEEIQSEESDDDDSSSEEETPIKTNPPNRDSRSVSVLKCPFKPSVLSRGLLYMCITHSCLTLLSVFTIYTFQYRYRMYIWPQTYTSGRVASSTATCSVCVWLISDLASSSRQTQPGQWEWQQRRLAQPQPRPGPSPSETQLLQQQSKSDLISLPRFEIRWQDNEVPDVDARPSESGTCFWFI